MTRSVLNRRAESKSATCSPSGCLLIPTSRVPTSGGLPAWGQVQGPRCLACLSCTDESGSLYELERKTKRPFCYASLLSGLKEILPVRCLHFCFSETESTLNTDICLEPGVIYVASSCYKAVKTTISFIFNSGKIFLV